MTFQYTVLWHTEAPKKKAARFKNLAEAASVARSAPGELPLIGNSSGEYKEAPGAQAVEEGELDEEAKGHSGGEIKLTGAREKRDLQQSERAPQQAGVSLTAALLQQHSSPDKKSN
ncbi:hypothetical protein DPEC_G00350570 [Dallia pectoralis]|uniref:Uncharacterized protein n=1 Tax=Dallia pectoralis TaxID=75939 RepID=A0ACC2F1T4_DALPE|nr:hypothetical protein DPEC_G00350570 [Dallia pectoralis]